MLTLLMYQIPTKLHCFAYDFQEQWLAKLMYER